MDVRDAFRQQAGFCRAMNAPVTAALSEALADGVDRSSATGRAVLDWPGDAVADALPLRLIGGLHALYRSGAADVRALLAGRGSVAAVLARHDAALLPWLAGPPQTNEAGRSAALMTGLLHLAAAHGLPFELLEIGSSAGLNLLLGHYRFDLGGVFVGPAAATVRITPAWRGTPPPDVPVTIASTRGGDVAPIDLADAAAAERLAAYVWVDAAERQARLAAAIALVRAHGVRLDRGDAADWVEAQLAETQAAGTMRVVVHSVVWQYLGRARQARIRDLLHAAGAAATSERPFGWVMMEPNRDLAAHEVRVRGWPGGAMEVVARAHAHGAWVEGLASPEPATDYALSGVAPL
ncbi:DUF2332 domain-containing protein [Sphingomonas guangdongensis]|nr:DUF2332 family protein [Sphingomonas guangdongensis]